ncbi:MAG: preprotein translocase subunit SecG [Acidobacteria bacterium]|nr:MAG: preprotein translocase subunit SecG [Acidobacteriota bacterium]
MTILLTIIHVIVCLLLILIVLLQSGKSADLAGAFGGGGSQTAFGARGTATFLSKLTTGAAVIFMLTSFTLSLYTVRQKGNSVMEGAQTPASKQSAPAALPGQKNQPASNPTPAPPAPTQSTPSGQEAPATKQPATKK